MAMAASVDLFDCAASHSAFLVDEGRQERFRAADLIWFPACCTSAGKTVLAHGAGAHSEARRQSDTQLTVDAGLALPASDAEAHTDIQVDMLGRRVNHSGHEKAWISVFRLKKALRRARIGEQLPAFIQHIPCGCGNAQNSTAVSIAFGLQGIAIKRYAEIAVQQPRRCIIGSDV